MCGSISRHLLQGLTGCVTFETRTPQLIQTIDCSGLENTQTSPSNAVMRPGSYIVPSWQPNHHILLRLVAVIFVKEIVVSSN